MSKNTAFEGLGIVVTRPQHQAETLLKQFQHAGANTLSFPLLEIKQAFNPGLVKQQLANIDQYDLVIFVSKNAVDMCLNYIDPAILTTKQIATVGKQTAERLKFYGLETPYCPKEKFNSESLLALPEIQQFGKDDKIAIIRGNQGRDIIKQALTSKGADVDYIEVYKSIFPQNSLKPLLKFCIQQEENLILLTSGKSVKGLFSLWTEHETINHLTLVLGSSRMQKEIPEWFQGKILITKDPSDKTMYEGLLKIYG